VEVTPRPAASAQDLLDAINDIRPHVVHFSGHGWSDGLVMDNGSVDTPEGQELDFELLAKLLVATTTPPTLLVLNACETLGGADLLLSAVPVPVPVVVAMGDAIADVAASVFASQFYAAIASAQTVGVALAQAKVAMEIAQLDDAELPEAIARDDVDIDDVVLVRPPP
jgi:CHAT domain-containing protein